MSITPVVKNGVTYAIFVSGPQAVEGAKFITKDTDEFQIGMFERSTGYVVKPHRHPEHAKTINGTSEFIYVQEGSAEITVFDEDWNVLHTQSVAAGDFLVFFRGGHSLTMLQETRLIEVEQGPYPGGKKAKEYR